MAYDSSSRGEITTLKQFFLNTHIGIGLLCGTILTIPACAYMIYDHEKEHPEKIQQQEYAAPTPEEYVVVGGEKYFKTVDGMSIEDLVKDCRK